MEAFAPSEREIAVLRSISCAGFTYAPTRVLCEAAGWRQVDDEPDQGYVRYDMPLDANPDEQSQLSVLIAGRNKYPLAFLPLFHFEEYDKGREPFDIAFRGITLHLSGFLGAAARWGDYSYPHRADWSYQFAGWSLSDATLVLVQDELDIQFGMDLTLWVQPAGTAVEAPVKYE
jgi:hypothetical protein